MADWFGLMLSFIGGFIIGRLFPLYKKFNKFLDMEKKYKQHEEKLQVSNI